SGGLVRLWHSGHAGLVRSVLARPHGSLSPLTPALDEPAAHVLTVGADGENPPLRVHAADDGRPLGPPLVPPEVAIAASFAPAARVLYAVCGQGPAGQLAAWHWDTGRPVFAPVRLAFRPTDVCGGPGALVVIGLANEVQLHDPATGAVRVTRG